MSKVVDKLEDAMSKGLKSSKVEKSVPCFPTYVTDILSTTGVEKDVYLVVDFAAPHLQIIAMDITEDK